MSKDILPFFKSELQSIYSDNETDSLAFWCIDSILKLSRSQWLLKSNYPLSNEVINSFEEVVSRLKKHEPIQYIFGECEFNGLMFKLSPACLIPRPETEELIRWILEDDFINGLDIGTGSGCIAISLAKFSNINMKLTKIC